MEMERVKQFYQVTLLDEEYTLTADDFHKFQKECSEIAAFRNHGVTGCTHCQHQDHDTTEFDHVADEPDQLVELDLAQGGYCNDWIRRPPSMQELLEMKEKPEILVELDDNRLFLLTKSPHKAVAEVVKTAMEAKPMNVNIVKDTVLDSQRPKQFKKDVTKYAKMINDGEPAEAIKNLMLRESFCAPSSIPYFFKQAGEMAKTLKADKPKPATFVTVISNDLTETQILNSCYAANHSQVPVEHCKEIARFGYDMEQNEIVFRGQGLGNYTPKEILAVYDMTHTEV